MECGKLTAKLRDAVPVCFLVENKEVKRYKNIEIPDELKKLPYKEFRFDVPMSGAITFKIMFEQGILPKVWPEARQRRTRGANATQEAVPAEPAHENAEPVVSTEAPEQETTAIAIAEPKTEESDVEAEQQPEESEATEQRAEEADEAQVKMEVAYNVTGGDRKALVNAISVFTEAPAVYQNAPTFAYHISEYRVDKHGTLTGPANGELIAALAEQGFMVA